MIRLYHNPCCSKSRAALTLLEGSGRKFDLLRYLDDPPTAATLHALTAKLDHGAAQLLRRNEPEFADTGLGKSGEISDEDAIRALVAQPRLLQRPILETDDQAVIGRPPENILTLL
ncbi:MAG: arsenate reductase (glutaredoxin) [Salinisphaera sp.]|nr:arsenate reductase (glutaredoxin) [Salinisphaera sp.]MDN5938887.1 arsenate reductase (glutaredoxin) [Salinisphaera sp.]